MGKPRTRVRMAGRRPRRSLDWESFTDNAQIGVGGAGGTILGLLAPTDVQDHGGRCTVTRVIIDCDVYNVIGNAGAPTGGAFYIGVIVVDDDGVGNVPNLNIVLTDVIEMSWMYYRMSMVGNNLLASDGEVFADSSLRADRHIDIPVKRKLRDTQYLACYLQLEPVNGIALPTIATYNFSARVLVQGAT